MKKNVLALSIATMVGGLGFSGAAMAQAAFDVNESGTGVIQIVPYFSAQDGNATVLHVVNTDANNAKAVKIRFRGASNSDDLLDFQVFLSPNDAWTGLASANANGHLQLVTNDSSCTLPAEVRTQGVTLAPLDRLTNRLWDTVEKQRAQTREGYIEILEMASIPQYRDAAPGSVGTTPGINPLYTAVKHVKGTDGVMKAPCTDSAFTFLDSIPDGGIAEARKALNPTTGRQLAAPTGALTASWYIMNVAKSTTFSGSATALQVTNSSDTNAAVPVYAPQKAQSLATAMHSADPLFLKGAATNPAIDRQDFDVPDLSTPLVTVGLALAAAVPTQAMADAQAGNLSAAINRASVHNQFYQDAGLNAATDWVFSMPTRRYLVAANYGAKDYTKDVYNVSAGATGGSVAAADNVRYVHRNGVASLAANNKFNDAGKITVNAQGQICVVADGQTFYDREEDSITDGRVVSPGTAKKLNLCGEVHVATFGAASPLGAAIATSNVDTSFGQGWGSVNFGTGASNGVPVLGAAFTAAKNPNAAAGMVGNYGITWPHFYTNK